MTALVSQCRNLFAHQISTRYIYFQFPFWPTYRHWHHIFHRLAKFHLNRTTHGRNCRVMTSYRFSKVAAGSHVGFYEGNIRPPTKCYCLLQLLLKFRLDLFRRCCHCKILGVLAWNCLFTWIFPLRMRRINGMCTSEISTMPSRSSPIGTDVEHIP